jgi:hypothetical protein
VSILLVIRSEEQVEGVEDVAACLAKLGRRPLTKREEVIDEDVDVCEGVAGRRRERRRRGLRRRRLGEAFERMWRGEVGQAPGVIDEIRCGFRGSAEVRCGFNEPHGQREVEANKRLGVAGMRGHHEGELGQISQTEPDPHVGIRQVDLGHMHGPVSGVGVNDGVEEPVQGAAKLHGFRRSLLLDGAVGAAPGVVVDEPGAASSLRNAADWAET